MDLRDLGAKWRELMYDYSQVTTIHGVRYVTKPAAFWWRRGLWLMIVLIALGSLVWLTWLNMIELRQHHRQVSLDRHISPALEFPEVTICNFNQYRLSGLASLGMFDTFWEHYNYDAANQDSVFLYVPGFCISSQAEKNRLLSTQPEEPTTMHRLVSGVSSITCEYVCRLFTTSCSGIFYNRSSHSCELTSAVFEYWDYETTANCSHTDLEYYRHWRFTDEARLICHFELYDSDTGHGRCSLNNDLDLGDDTWSIATPTGTDPQFDHTLSAATGHYMEMMMTDKHPSSRAVLRTPYMYFNQTCLSMFIWFTGHTPVTLQVSTIAENQQEHILASKTGQPNMTYWQRLFVQIPPGVFYLKIEGIRPVSGVSGIVIDDVLLDTCDIFYRNCANTMSGDDFIGNIDTTASGERCMRWADVGFDLGDFGDSFGDPGNYCRNPGGHWFETPSCFVSDYNDPEPCDVPLCGCNENQFRCLNGICIPRVYVCNGVVNCPDISDELLISCPERNVMSCDFEDEYNCGYLPSPFLISLNWLRASGLAVLEAGAEEPVFDYSGSILGHFMLADTREGIEGEAAFVISQYIDVPHDFCLLFRLFMKPDGHSTEDALRIYISPASHPNALPFFLYQYPGDQYWKWEQQKLSLPAGRFQIWFQYTMGFPYACTAAIDNVNIEPCSGTPMLHTMEPQSRESLDSAYTSSSLKELKNCTMEIEKECVFRSSASNSRGNWRRLPSMFVDEILNDTTPGECPNFYPLQGVFESPGYPGNYSQLSHHCVGHIRAPANSLIQLQFPLFDIQASDNCSLDYVKIYYDPSHSEGHHLCNSNWNSSQVLAFNSSDVWIYFHSGRAGSAAGFRGSYMTDVPSQTATLHYLSYDGYRSPSQYEAALYSPLLNVSSMSCLTLDYLARCDLVIYTIGDQLDWVLNSDKTNGVWNRVRRTLNGGVYQVVVSALYSAESNGFLAAFQNFDLTPGECSEKFTGHLEGSVDCDFNDIDNCGYLDISTYRWSWLRKQVRDEDGNWNIVMAAAFLTGQQRMSLSLSSPTLTVGEPRCLKFIYKKSSEAAFWVSTQPATSLFVDLVVRYADFSWNSAAIELPVGSYSIVFEAYAAEEAAVYVDDIRLTEGTCPTQEDDTLNHAAALGETIVPRNAPHDINKQEYIHLPDKETILALATRKPNWIGETTMREVIEVSGPRQFDLIVSCMWNNTECPRESIKETLTDFGRCYSFNWMQDNPYASEKPGADHGLRLVLNIKQYEHMRGISLDAGVKVQLTKQTDLATVRDRGSALPQSAHSQLNMKYSRVISLPPPCGVTDLQIYQNETYSRAYCNLECETFKLFEGCGCILYYMRPFSEEMRQCTVYDYFNCVKEWFEAGVSTCSGCTYACDKVTYSVLPHHAELSVLGLADLYNAITLEEREIYWQTDESRNRFYPDLFINTIDMLYSLAADLADLVESIREVTGSSTSLHALVTQSIELFNNIILNDTQKAFKELEHYTEAYEQAYGKIHEAVRESVSKTRSDLLILLQLLSKRNGDYIPQNIDMERRVLFKSLSRVLTSVGTLSASSRIPLSKESLLALNPELEKFTPDFILDNSDTQEDCSNRLTFNGTLPEEIFTFLTKNDVESVINATHLIPFKDIMLSLDAYEKQLHRCSHQYKDILAAMGEARTTFMDPSQWFDGVDFQYDEEVQDLTRDIIWVHELLEGYLMENKTKYDISEAMTSEALSSITVHADQIVNYVKSVSVHLIEFQLETLQATYRQWYTHVVDLFVQQQSYFIEVRPLVNAIRNLSMWYQPESNLQSAQVISFPLDSSTLWRSWAVDMNIGTFANTSLQLVLNHIDFKFFEVLKETVKERMNTNLIRKLKKLDTCLSQVHEYFRAYDVETDVKEQYILDNYLILDIFYGELITMYSEQKASYSKGDFLSDLGGNMGLLIGASVITVFELLDLVIYHAAGKLLKKKRNTDSDQNTSGETHTQCAQNDLNVRPGGQTSFAENQHEDTLWHIASPESSLPNGALRVAGRRYGSDDRSIISTRL